MQRPLISVSGRWRVERLVGTAAEIHGRPIGAERTVSVCRVSGPAVVLGSAQASADIDSSRAGAGGVDVVRRRSGGGAVFVDDTVVWVDVVLPRGDALWDDDVGRSMWWVGDLWARVLAQVCGGDVAGSIDVHRGAMQRSQWSSILCFAGLGPGEVRLGRRKVVGVSQRRTREWALFQTACLLRWQPNRVLALTTLDEGAQSRATVELAESVVGLADLALAVNRDVVEGVFIDGLDDGA